MPCQKGPVVFLSEVPGPRDLQFQFRAAACLHVLFTPNATCGSDLSCRRQIFEGEGSSGEELDGGTTAPKKRRNKKNRYGMPKTSGRRFRAERMNILGMRQITEFSIDEVGKDGLRAERSCCAVTVRLGRAECFSRT